MIIRPVGTAFYMWMDRRTDTTKLIGAFHKLAKVPKIVCSCVYLFIYLFTE
jgi:uncharacterized membrane protein